MASFGLVALTHTCCYSFMHRWRSFGLVTPRHCWCSRRVTDATLRRSNRTAAAILCNSHASTNAARFERRCIRACRLLPASLEQPVALLL